jgi:ubiquinone/menaquinone biosynthesis C-methylase UbiE
MPDHPLAGYDRCSLIFEGGSGMNTTDKGYKGMAMEGLVAAWYAKMTQKDDQRHVVAAREMCQHIPAGSRVLEIAPGPGYFAVELARLGDYEVTGIDISQSFVKIAQEHAARAGVQVDFRLGNASALPFGEASFDFMICQAAFKNFSQPVQALAEMHRVLRAGGKALIIDLRRDASSEAIEQGVREMKVGKLNQYAIRWTFRNMLLKRAYSKDDMVDMVAQTPFQTCRVEDDGIGFRVWLEK